MVVAGESANDRNVLRCFLEAFCPQMQGRIVFLNGTTKLRDASDVNLRTRSRHFAQLVRAKAAHERAEVAAVFLHEDLDEVDSTRYQLVRRRVQKALGHEMDYAHYVLAVWEIEAWLLLFPEVISSYAAGWQVPPSRRGRDTGLLNDPKRIFKEEVSRAGTRYRESDAPAIANRIAAQGNLPSPTGSNRSFHSFKIDAMDRCQQFGQR